MFFPKKNSSCRRYHGPSVPIALTVLALAMACTHSKTEATKPAPAIASSEIGTASAQRSEIQPAATKPSTLAEIYDLDAVDLHGLQAGTTIVAPECEAGEGFTVHHEPDVLAEPIYINGVVEPDRQIAGDVVEGFRIEPHIAAGAVVDAGCVIEHDAAPGCLGRVEITDARIPGVELPRVSIPDVVVGGHRISGAVAEAVVSPELHVAGVIVEESCDLGFVLEAIGEQVDRTFASRPALTREFQERPLIFRDAVSLEPTAGSSNHLPRTYVGRAVVPRVHLQRVRLPDQPFEYIDPVVDGVETLSNDAQTAFFIPSDVLFAFDSADLQLAAVEMLHSLVLQIRDELGSSELLIAGHTDSVGDDSYNQQLSEERARAVATWLTQAGSIDPHLVSSQGYGESLPAADNSTEDGRKQNRRVVIAVLSE